MRAFVLKAALMGFCSMSALSAAAYAQEAAPQPDGDDVVVVQGRRLSEADQAVGLDEASNVVAVTREALLSAPAGISGLKMLESLPGFNVQTEGPSGSTSSGTR
jgi:iron complex outermembrane receptor protein